MKRRSIANALHVYKCVQSTRGKAEEEMYEP